MRGRGEGPSETRRSAAGPAEAATGAPEGFGAGPAEAATGATEAVGAGPAEATTAPSVAATGATEATTGATVATTGATEATTGATEATTGGADGAPAAPPRASLARDRLGSGGSIYDLGYRGYDGPRLGRRHAIRALFIHTFKVSYGIGRGGRAKLGPIILGALAIIPAIIGVGIVALARQAGEAGQVIEQASPIRHDTYFGVITTLMILFCAAQAPEILGRDQRYQLLSLYFSRALRRTDYALARFAGLAAAILVFVLLPHAIIFAGFVLSARDTGSELNREVALLPAIVGQSIIVSGLLAGIATLVSAFTPRRIYATTTIVVVLAVTPVIAQALIELGSDSLAAVLALASPADLLDATNAFLFGRPSESQVIVTADLPGQVYLVAAALITAACLATLARRFARIAA